MGGWLRAVEQKYALHGGLGSREILLVVFDSGLDSGEIGSEAGDGILAQGGNVASDGHSEIALASRGDGGADGGGEKGADGAAQS